MAKGILTMGPLAYQAWCRNATREDVDSLVAELNTVQGVSRATRLETHDGYMVSALISGGYPTEVVLNSIQRELIAWAKRLGIPYTHG